jgi:5'-3' exonuclease
MQIKTIVEQTGCDHLVFAWDSIESKRRNYDSLYKANRQKNKEEDPTLIEAFFQFDELHTTILPRLGFVNNFRIAGYEADDIIAQVCRGKADTSLVTIASNDQDLYQLLGNGVRMYKPTKGVFYTAKDFREEFMGLCPAHWVSVKAIAGCNGDNVKGIRGVGEKTAVKYLMDTSGTPHKKIDTHEAHKIISHNWPLVSLPYEGLQTFEIIFPQMDYQKWKEFCHEYEFTKFLKGSFWRDLFNYKAPEGFFMPPVKSYRYRGKR